MAGVVALALMMAGLAGCALNAAVSPTPAATTNNDTGTPGAHATLTLPTLTVVASPSGNGGTGGANAEAFCGKPPSISVHPGSNVPEYPGTPLHFSQANGNNAFFGYCTSASTSDVQNYYAQKLPQSGWTGLQTSTIAAVIQITATQCAGQNSPRIIVTIQPDSTGTTATSIAIVVLAGAC